MARAIAVALCLTVLACHLKVYDVDSLPTELTASPHHFRVRETDGDRARGIDEMIVAALARSGVSVSQQDRDGVPNVLVLSKVGWAPGHHGPGKLRTLRIEFRDPRSNVLYALGYSVRSYTGTLSPKERVDEMIRAMVRGY